MFGQAMGLDQRNNREVFVIFFFPYHCIIWGSLCPQHLYPNEREIIQTWFGKGPALVSKGDFGGTEIALRVVGEATCSPLNAYIWFWPEFTNDF